MKEHHNFITEYIKELDKIHKRGNAKEHSYRHVVIKLFENIAREFEITNEPSRIECGAPDYVVSKNNIPWGYIEAKDINTDLNSKNIREQINRYKEALNNLIVTDYLNFIYYKAGEYKLNVIIGKLIDGKIIENKDGYDSFLEMINVFTGYKGIKINNSEKLAKIMANKTRLLSSIIKNIFVVYKNRENSIKEQMNIFKEYLIHDLYEDTFADIYSQTIAYGLFAAKLYAKSDFRFSRISVADLIPQSNIFLKRFFHYIMGPDIDENIKWFVDDFAEVFNIVDIAAIKKEFENKDQDPYIYFYETYLQEYDRETKKEKGAYYTPVPVVRFIVNSVDEILKKEFNLAEGIADNSKTKILVKEDGKEIEKTVHKVQILDPATGTGTFLAEVIEKIYEHIKVENIGKWSGYCENDLLPRIHGFEYLMASYTIAHLKIDMKLREKGFAKIKWDNERLGIYLTNTLEEPKTDIKKLELVKWLSDEAEAAQKVKANTPVMVVLGNPPYNQESQNIYSSNIYLSYKKEPGGINKLNEKNIKCLNDDYVKFIAYGHSLISKYNEGVLAYINNSGFLDNATFRGMRWSLLNTFDKIYVLNLYGDVEKNKLIEDKEDENIFDIKKGVSINIFVKNNKKKAGELAVVFYAEIRGTRTKKFEYLNKNINFNNIKWKKLQLSENNYYLVEKNFKNESVYNQYFGIHEIFNAYSSGIDTGRDDFAINAEKDELIKKIEKLLSLDDEKAREELKLGEDSRDWKIRFVKNDLKLFLSKDSKIDEQKIVQLLYKPFDIRYTYFTGNSRGYLINPRNTIMKHFIIGNNCGLIFNRGIIGNITPVFITNKIIIGRSWSRSGTTSRDYVAPLFIYTFENNSEKQVNLNPAIIKKIESILNMKHNDNEKDNNTFTSLDILDYIYSFLHSVIYREKFNELLNIDFPRIKYPKNKKEFMLLIELGGKLRKLHLMEDLENIKDIISYPEPGTDEVEKIRYENEKVYINAKQYFEKISPEIWDYYIGGYQPANQWLKEKKGKKLEYNDNKHFNRIIYIIQETIQIQKQIDKILEATEW